MYNKFSYKQFIKQCIEESHKKNFTGNGIDDFMLWKDDFRIILSNALGLYSLPNFRYKVKTAEVIKLDGYTRIKIYIETLPSVSMPLYILRPEKSNNKIAIALPCHFSNKDITCGVDDREDYAKQIAAFPDRSYGLELLKKGYTVYCPDQVGAGERALDPADSLKGSCTAISNVAISMGFTYSGLFINDLTKLLDYIYDTNDNPDITCVGFSGGGLHAMYLAALDIRVHKCVISGYFHNYKNSVFDTHLCSCNFIPRIWSLCDMSDIASMIAPRPLYIENGTMDKLNGILGIDDPIEEFSKVLKAYALFNAQDKLKHYIFEGGHVFSGQCYDFLDSL